VLWVGLEESRPVYRILEGARIVKKNCFIEEKKTLNILKEFVKTARQMTNTIVNELFFQVI
jgi:hypothetical protein